MRQKRHGSRLVCVVSLALATRLWSGLDDGLLVHLPLDGTLDSKGTLACDVQWCANTETQIERTRGTSPAIDALLSEVGTDVCEFRSGVVGDAVHLTPRSYIDLSAKGLVQSEQGTIAFWLKPDWDAKSAPTPPWRYHFISSTSQAVDTAKADITGFRSLYFWMTPKSVFASFARSKKVGKHFVLDPLWRPRQWNHIALTWQAGEQLCIYVNASDEGQDGDVSVPRVDAAESLRVGRKLVDISDLSAWGLIDELRIWNRRLDAAEVTALYKAECPAAVAPEQREQAKLKTGWLDIKQGFGAKGDGKADDSEALQRAFESKQIVFLSPGIYRFTRTLRLYNGVQVVGPSGDIGPWNPFGQATLRFDGDEGAVAVLADRTKHVQLRNFGIDGSGKAGVGLKWINVFYTRSRVQGVTITGTREHAMYLATMGVITFQDLDISKNFGNGITVGSYPNVDIATGEVNAVSFTNCGIVDNGLECNYDGETNVRTGYGFGIIGHCTNITLTSCTIEANGGPGFYMGPARKVCVMVRDSYFESNCQAIITKDRELHGKDFLQRDDRVPVGRKVSILVDSPHNRMSSIAFENIFISGKRNGIWLKGSGPQQPILFRNMYKPNVIYSEHGNWEWVDSTFVPVAGDPGINVRAWRQQWEEVGRTHQMTNFIPGSELPSGHPGICVERGRRTIMPAPPAGLSLYVDTATGDDARDGRTPDKAWASLDKVSRLFANTDVDTPFTVDIGGDTAGVLDLRNLHGAGSVTLRLAAGVRLEQLRVANVECQLSVVGTDGVSVGTVVLDRCAATAISGLACVSTEQRPALRCSGGSHVKVLDCVMEGDEGKGTGLLADLSHVYVRGGTVQTAAPDCGVVAVDGAVVVLDNVRNLSGQSLRGGTVRQP